VDSEKNKVSWKDKATNADVLQRVNEIRSILDITWCPKHKWLGWFLGM